MPAQHSPSAGRIEVIAGCMFAGKTAALIGRLRMHEARGLRVVAVAHWLDQGRAMPSDDGGVAPADGAPDLGAGRAMQPDSGLGPQHDCPTNFSFHDEVGCPSTRGDDRFNTRKSGFAPTAATLRTHHNHTYPALALASSNEIRAAAESIAVDVVGIDEVQFFDGGVVEILDAMRRAGLVVIAAGIHNNAWGRPFEPLPQLMAIADSVEIMTVPCTVCGAGAQFTQRVSPIVAGNMIGGPGDYEPRCATCFVPLPS